MNLLPCPFCGSTKVKLFEYPFGFDGDEPDFVQCQDCSSDGPYGTKETAAEKWNARASALSHEAPLLSHECGTNMVCKVCGSLPLSSTRLNETPTEQQIDRALLASIPGGSRAEDWFMPHESEKAKENIRDVVAHMLAAGAPRSATLTPEWVPLAAKRTRETIEHAGHIPWTFEADPCGGQHIDYMLAELESGRIGGNKAHRWLGWVQAIACEKAGVALEALKAVNKTASMVTTDGKAEAKP